MRLDRFALRALYVSVLVAAGAAPLFAQSASLPPPRQLKAAVNIECRKNYVRLSWDGKRPEDGAIAGYRVYCDRRSPGELAAEAELPLVTGHVYDFEVPGNGGVDMRFAVAAVSAMGADGALSEAVTVVLPTFRLPDVEIASVTQQDRIAVVVWEYPAGIRDLDGFRLFRNGTLIRMLPSDSRRYVSLLRPARTDSYEIEAVTKYGFVSRRSRPRAIALH